MELQETLYLIGFISMMLITLYKVYNILSNWEEYDIKKGFIFFILFLFSWSVVFITSLINYNNMLMIQLFKLGNGFLAFNALLFIFEIIKTIIQAVDNTNRKAYRPNIYKQ